MQNVESHNNRYPVGHCPESTLAIIALYFEKKDDADLDFLSVKVITPPLMINPFFFLIVSSSFFLFISLDAGYEGTFCSDIHAVPDIRNAFRVGVGFFTSSGIFQKVTEKSR